MQSGDLISLLTANPGYWITCGAIIVLICLSAFFSGSETALTAASRSRLRTSADDGDRRAARALMITGDRERLIGAVLLGNNLVNILAASLAASLFTSLFGDAGLAISTLVMTTVILIFAEIMPKTYAVTHPERAARLVSPLIGGLIRILSPLLFFIQLLAERLLRGLGLTTEPSSGFAELREEIVGAIALGHSSGTMGTEHRDRLLGALDLGSLTVGDIMCHRSAMEMIDIAAPVEDTLKLCAESQFTRLPVYRDGRENIIGVVHTKDVLRLVMSSDAGEISSEDLQHVAMEPYFVPETTTLEEQMQQFLVQRVQFALVVDEYGSLQGLTTLEDILEEIVGDIHDEHDDRHEAALEQVDDGACIADGRTPVREINKALNWDLPDEAATTVAGLVIHEARKIPEIGQQFDFHGHRFTVMDRKANRIVKIHIRKSELD